MYLRGGNYALGSVDLNFDRPGVTYKAYANELPVIQITGLLSGGSSLGYVNINADNVTLQGVILQDLNTQRVSSQSGSAPSDIPLNILAPKGKTFTLRGCIISDLKGQFIQSGANNLNLIDCLIINTGWSGPDRGHGHIWYSHGDAGQVQVHDNNIFAQAFGDGLEWYSVSTSVIGLHITRMIEFSPNGSNVGGEATTTVDDVIVDNSAFWNEGQNYGYLSGTKGNLTLTNNYYGINPPTIQADWASVTNTGNTTGSGGSNVVKVYPCTTPGLVAHIAVFNWQQLDTVSVDVSGLGMTPGVSYRLRQGYDPINDVTVFTYDGSGAITLPFTGRMVAVPTGYAGGALATLDKRFGAWRLEAA